MKQILTIFLTVSISLFSTVNAQDLDEVLENYYEVIGLDKLSKVKSMKATGNAIQYGMETPFTNIVTRSGKFYLEVPVQGQLMKQGYNGETGWITMPWTGSNDPVELTGAQLKSVRTQSDMDGQLVDYEAKGYKTELLDTEDMEGTEVYVIQQTDQDGDVYKHYIDADNYVLLKTKIDMTVQAGEVEAETYFSNYKMLNGILIAYSVEVKVGGQSQRMIVVDSVEFNIKIDDSIFEKPEVIAPVETPDEK